MREKQRNFWQSGTSEPGQRKERGRRSMRLISLCATTGILMLLCVCAWLAVVPQNVYAASDCGVLILCPPTATPKPEPSPTPTPRPTPTSTPKPTPTAHPTPTATPTVPATPTVASTASSTTAAQTPDTHPTNLTPANAQGGSQASSSQGQSGSPYMLVVITITFLFLLLCLGAGLLVFRRMLLPQIEVKLPPSGARSWSRFRIPNPKSLVADSDTQVIWSTASAGAADPFYSLEPNASGQDDPFYTPGMGVSGGSIPALPVVPKPSLFDSDAFLESILTSSLKDEPEDENETSVGNKAFFTADVSLNDQEQN